MWLLAILNLTVGCGYHLGRPEPAYLGLQVGEIEVSAPEPALQDQIRHALALSLQERRPLDVRVTSPTAPTLRVEVLEASNRVSAVEGGARVHLARLVLSFEGPTTDPLVLSSERSYRVEAGATLDAAMARSQAFEWLSRELVEEATDWILYRAEVAP